MRVCFYIHEYLKPRILRVNIPLKTAKAIPEVIFTKSNSKKPSAERLSPTASLPPREYDGEKEESGVILSAHEAIDLVLNQGKS